jgi:hypothetical protein
MKAQQDGQIYFHHSACSDGLGGVGAERTAGPGRAFAAFT